MIVKFYLIAIGVLVTYAQDSTYHSTPSMLRECYENEYLLTRDNRLPHTMNTLISIIRKIENTGELNLRNLAVALLHRFRLDGIFQNPNVPKQDGVTPYAPIGFQYHRQSKLQSFIPGNAVLFPNNSITDVERCTLHFMLSSSTEVLERGDEGTVCRYASSAYRRARSIDEIHETSPESINNDVETLSPEQIEQMTNQDIPKGDTIDPNSLYPELPPNHPDIARMYSFTISKCPVENGVVKTRWGAVSAGSVLAGIAAALQPQIIPLGELFQDGFVDKPYAASVPYNLDNKWFATIAGDLAEVALRQGPQNKKIVIGAKGDWNSTTMPRWYFLNSNENLEFTTAEIRGDLDGLILANEIESLNAKSDLKSNLRLSQILDMYYSTRGLFNSTIRACNRRVLFTAVSPNSTMSAQAISASLVLRDTSLAKATLDITAIEKFSVQAARELSIYIPSSMNQDLSCQDTDNANSFNQASIDLTIILDINWPFESIQPMLAHLLENIEINPFNSNFTILSGHDGNVMINSSDSILNFYSFNSSHYKNFTTRTNFDLPKSLETLKLLRIDQLNREKNSGVGGGRSDIVLIVPYTSTISESDKNYCLERLRKMREELPDTNILILTYGSKDRWSDLVKNPATDSFSIGIGATRETLAPLDNLISRMKQVPKRLINTQCGADYISIGSSNSYTDYVAPFEINFYKFHPNYFFTTSSTPMIKIQGSGWGTLSVCSSRDILHVNSTETKATASCTTISNNIHTIALSCADAKYIHNCPPVYISVAGNSTTNSFQCTDPRVCRFPHQIKYTFSYENLVCVSSATATTFNLTLSILFVVHFLFRLS